MPLFAIKITKRKIWLVMMARNTQVWSACINLMLLGFTIRSEISVNGLKIATTITTKAHRRMAQHGFQINVICAREKVIAMGRRESRIPLCAATADKITAQVWGRVFVLLKIFKRMAHVQIHHQRPV